jgi:hypothetical protein
VDRERLIRLAASEFGVFTRGQARACGYTPYQIRRRISDGEWQTVLGAGLAAERRLTELLRVAGITGWTANAEIRDATGLIGIGDVVFAGSKLVLEVDGLAYHVTPERFQRDRQRQNRLVAAGWTCCGSPGMTSTSVRITSSARCGVSLAAKGHLVTGAASSGSRLWPTSL